MRKTLLLLFVLCTQITSAQGQQPEVERKVDVTSETINIPLSDQSFKSGIKKPARGMSKQQVIEAFGEPKQQFNPRGEPPIERWIYTDFTVYFETRWVIHSVLTSEHAQ